MSCKFSLFDSLPIDIMGILLDFMDAYDITNLFMAGNQELKGVLKTKVLRFTLDVDFHRSHKLPFYWPGIISSFIKLEELYVRQPFYAIHIPIYKVDLSQVSKSLKHLELRHGWLMNPFPILNSLVHLDIAPFFPKLESLTLYAHEKYASRGCEPHMRSPDEELKLKFATETSIFILPKYIPATLVTLNLLNVGGENIECIGNPQNCITQDCIDIAQEDKKNVILGNVKNFPETKYILRLQPYDHPVWKSNAVGSILPSQLESFELGGFTDMSLAGMEWPQNLTSVKLQTCHDIDRVTSKSSIDWIFLPQSVTKLGIECTSAEYLMKSIFPSQLKTLCIQKAQTFSSCTLTDLTFLPPALDTLLLSDLSIQSSVLNTLPKTLTAFTTSPGTGYDQQSLSCLLKDPPSTLKILEGPCLPLNDPELVHSLAKSLPQLEVLHTISFRYQNIPDLRAWTHLKSLQLALGGSVVDMDRTLLWPPVLETLLILFTESPLSSFKSSWFPRTLTDLRVIHLNDLPREAECSFNDWPPNLTFLRLNISHQKWGLDFYKNLPRSLLTLIMTSKVNSPRTERIFRGSKLKELPRNLQSLQLRATFDGTDYPFMPPVVRAQQIFKSKHLNP